MQHIMSVFGKIKHNKHKFIGVIKVSCCIICKIVFSLTLKTKVIYWKQSCIDSLNEGLMAGDNSSDRE